MQQHENLAVSGLHNNDLLRCKASDLRPGVGVGPLDSRDVCPPAQSGHSLSG